MLLSLSLSLAVTCLFVPIFFWSYIPGPRQVHVAPVGPHFLQTINSTWNIKITNWRHWRATKTGSYWKGVNIWKKQTALGEFSICYGFYPEGRTPIALCKAARRQKESLKSRWLEEQEDRVWGKYNRWKVKGEVLKNREAERRRPQRHV